MSNLPDLIQTFGLQSVQILDMQLPKDVSLYKSKIPKSKIGQDKIIRPSDLNTPVYAEIVFHGVTQGESTIFSDIKLPGVIISVSQQKNIVKTAIQGKDGTVKEYMSRGDYSVSVNGILTGALNQYPLAAVQNLQNMLNYNQPITITSTFLQIFDINQIVVDSYEIAQESGMYSRQAFSISALSDEGINLLFA